MATAAKKATTKTQDVAEQTQENVNSMIAIGQDTANVALDGMVQTAKVANTTMQNMVNVGLNAQEAGISVARNYFDNMNRIGKEMIDIFARNGEKTINSVTDIEFAIQREATDIAKDVDEKTEKAVENQVGKSNAR